MVIFKYGYLSKLFGSYFYKDKMTVKRWQNGTNSDGSVSSQVLNSFLLDEPCLVYPLTKDASRDRHIDVAEQKQSFTIFYSGDCGIKKGDVLICSVLEDDGTVQKVIEGNAGAPCPYPDHTEVDLYEWKVKE